MRRIIATLVAGAAVCGAIAGPSTVTDAQAKRACLEDEPCWNWNAMGNGARGVIVNRRTVVVDHRRFCALVRQDAIDWKRTPHLKGDGPCIRRVRAGHSVVIRTGGDLSVTNARGEYARWKRDRGCSCRQFALTFEHGRATGGYVAVNRELFAYGGPVFVAVIYH